jgi:hypothetical protein
MGWGDGLKPVAGKMHKVISEVAKQAVEGK